MAELLRDQFKIPEDGLLGVSVGSDLVLYKNKVLLRISCPLTMFSLAVGDSDFLFILVFLVANHWNPLLKLS